MADEPRAIGVLQSVEVLVVESSEGVALGGQNARVTGAEKDVVRDCSI